jgi:hypothetical protein
MPPLVTLKRSTAASCCSEMYEPWPDSLREVYRIGGSGIGPVPSLCCGMHRIMLAPERESSADWF